MQTPGYGDVKDSHASSHENYPLTILQQQNLGVADLATAVNDPEQLKAVFPEVPVTPRKLEVDSQSVFTDTGNKAKNTGPGTSTVNQGGIVPQKTDGAPGQG